MQTRLPRVPWRRPAALAAVAVPSIFMLTQERTESRAEARPTTSSETSEQNRAVSVHRTARVAR